jgi:sodium/hydrogen antiporter
VVLVLIVFATAGDQPGLEALELLGETGLGALIGALLGAGAIRVLPRLPRGGLVARYEGVYALGVALVAFGLADATYGNGLIAAFLAGIVLAAREEELPHAFLEFNEGVSAVLQTVTFFLFGALLVSAGFDGSVVALGALIVVVLLVARPVAVLTALAGTSLPRAERLFIAWFGPKGVASMLFALIALESTAAERTLVFEIAAFVVLGSIAAHGLTDTVGARWIERHVRRD